MNTGIMLTEYAVFLKVTSIHQVLYTKELEDRMNLLDNRPLCTAEGCPVMPSNGIEILKIEYGLYHTWP